jgi:hypothetical protein
MDEGITASFNAKGGKAPKETSPAERKRILQEVADMAASAVTPPSDAAKHRLMAALMFSKSAYDDEFDRIHAQFLPLLNDLDKGKPRSVIFIDPSEYAGAKAVGIDTKEYLSTALSLNGVYANSASLFMMDMSLSVQDKRTKGHNSTVTNPSASQAAGNSCVIVPLSHFGTTGVDLKGMTAGEISTYVNYHEFFHCMNDVYNNDKRANAAQKREMFSDVGAALEMIRRGSPPSIIDSILEWREKQTDASHHTQEGLKALKQTINSIGVDKVKALTQKEVMALSYIVTEGSASSPLGYKWLEMKEDFAKPGPVGKMISWLFDKPHPDALPKGFDPQKALEEKAMRMAGKITPVSLVLANGELQREYRAQYDKTTGGNEMYPQMMIATQDALIGSVTALDYEKVNAQRKAKLTAEDREDITFVKNGGKTGPAPGESKPMLAIPPKAKS